MKLFLCVVNLLLLLLLVEAAKHCKDNAVRNELTKKCETPKCPPGQDWYATAKKCAKFGVVATGFVDESGTKNAENQAKCRDGFIWIESRKLCAQQPKICTDSSCHSTTPRPQTPEDCKNKRVWDEIKRMCVHNKQIKTVA